MSKVWLITGSSRGFGRSLAEAVLAKGDQLVATARKTEQIADLTERYGSQVRIVQLDVNRFEQTEAAIKVAFEAFGRLDVLVNNAGYGNVSSIEETSMEDFRAQVETNLWGVINVTKAALPMMREQGSGHIVQFSSIGGRTGAPGLGPYQTAKWAVEGFSEVLSKEVGPLGLKVTLIEPGGFRTDWAGSSMQHIEPRDEYKETVGGLLKHLRDVTGKENGDPDKAAQAIITMVNEENPPLRLLLGSDAVAIANAVDSGKLAETKRWEKLSLSTDFEARELDPAVTRMYDEFEE
ncbi:oxidoreductase [Paenibacillus aceris]|uniref:NAD(P)-dependent dehydrogenase (Short-subunit alcohol dehydrogenase family) n=1 Tax=Paenibacillus aceris TaxID=869555 RepID=A0ABS4HWP3_9BACL|nr:oxidoreductase [Paenibacillus aceris]MBP1962970.1 NAD(P)-dependent dehydrogenase (short-subunit alcohol dehydrogenase family) [Paenibacillus aceris]NHW38396.1 SDR family NAD(P)-dependent oxidoreductase [Paenibacillus aceris]